MHSQEKHPMSNQTRNRLQAFASLHWYDETIKFVFNFVTKTSELLLAAGVVISTANFLTDGDVMSHNKALSDAWSWAQALAIDSSLGIVFMNAFQAVRERDKIKAVIFFTLTALLATVAGLITHFDALSHASGLPVTDKGVSGIIPLWVMTALRALAVISFLLASRLKQVSFRELRQDWNQEPLRNQEPPREPAVVPQIDYQALAATLVEAMQQAGAIGHVNVVELGATALPEPKADTTSGSQEIESGTTTGSTEEEPIAAKLARVYEAIREERVNQNDQKPISARELARCANVRRSTCSDWLQQHGAGKAEEHAEEEKPSPFKSASSQQERGVDQESSR